MKLLEVNSGRKDCQFNIANVENKYNAKYVGQFCLRDKYGNWVNDIAEVFWQPTPPVEGYSNYFALFIRDGATFITSGASAVEGTLYAVQADDGEIIYSRYRHDYRVSQDKSVWIDGGRDYTRHGSHGKLIELKIVDGDFYEIENT